MPPPPTPTSLMDLPASWLLKLATHNMPYHEGRTAVSLFPTCAFFRDTVLQHRTAVAEFRVPIAAERFPAELARLCTVARRSTNVKLAFEGHADDDEDDNSSAPWTRTEPHITHLLVCAMAELGGPLMCVQEVHTKSLQQSALVPAWLKVCCPNVSSLKVEGTLTQHLLDLPPRPPARAASASPPGQGRPSLLTCQHLQSINMSLNHDDEDDDDDDEDDGDDDGGGGGGGGGGGHMPQWRQHIRQQLAALPSLTSLVTFNDQWMREPALVSTSITSLVFEDYDNTPHLTHLAVQFPNLRELDAWDVTVDDAGLEALLRVPHLERLSVQRFSLQRSHAHRTWAVRQLSIGILDVGALARLPLDSIQACSFQDAPWFTPSRDAQAVARVAEVVRHRGGLGTEGQGRVMVQGRDTAALLTTLGPVLAALPAAQRRQVSISNLQDATAATLQALGQALPGSVTSLQLWDCSLQPAAWPTLLPSLPATVTELQLHFSVAPTEEQLMAMCGDAVRCITVDVWGVTADTLQRVRKRLAEMGEAQLVFLKR